MKIAFLSDIHANLHALEAVRDGDPRAGCVALELRRRPRVESLRVDYDVQGAAEAIRASGLPGYYAAELIAGWTPEITWHGSES